MTIENMGLSHQVWSHGGSKRKDIKQPKFPPCRNRPICAIIGLFFHVVISCVQVDLLNVRTPKVHVIVQTISMKDPQFQGGQE